jgi:hypothetical protein
MAGYAWAMGAPIGLRVTSVGTLRTTCPATGRAILGPGTPDLFASLVPTRMT